MTTREVTPLLVALPVLGVERALQEREYFSVSVALGDIDGAGLPETVSANSGGNLMAFEHDSTLE